MIKILKHITGQPFIFATGLAALVHSTWALGTLFAGEQPDSNDPLQFAFWLLPALLIAFALDVGQIATSAEIRAGQLKAYRDSIRHARQHPTSKKWLVRLEELGILQYMPAKFGNGDAQHIIRCAEDSGREVGGFNAYGEGDTMKTKPHALYLALNEVETVTVEVKDGDDFEVDGAKFRYYSGSLWIDGGERDDIVTDSFEANEDGKATIVISKKHLEAYAKAVANGLYDDDDDYDYD